MKEMIYKACIPCAGTGSRLGSLTKNINKSLISIANRPALSHIIEKFPLPTIIVIALGYKGDLVEEFLKHCYPKRQFIFVQVSKYDGPGSGLGLSLLACKSYLQEPFVFVSCDTLVEEKIPSPRLNWMGYANVTNLYPYRTLDISADRVTCIRQKGEGEAKLQKAYIGLAGVKDYQHFWEAMEQGGEAAIRDGETYGMRSLLPFNVAAHKFNWCDTGNKEALVMTRKRFHKSDDPIILEKASEKIWFVGTKVVKFSVDKEFIRNRIKRAKELEGFVPAVIGVGRNMYSYMKVEGKILSNAITLPLFERLLTCCTDLWKVKTLTKTQESAFQQICLSFYRDKTLKRVDQFYKTFNRVDSRVVINGLETNELQALLNMVDWKWLAKGLPGRFHGDLHLENILWLEKEQKFIFLDWRQDFGGELSTGDIYYDLAKLLHGLIVSHELIANECYSINWQEESIVFDFYRKHILVRCEEYFYKWLFRSGFDVRKVKLLTSLIYLNIAALHHEPYSLLLFALGKQMLAEVLEKTSA